VQERVRHRVLPWPGQGSATALWIVDD
jgi:hypothetical protein